MHETASVAQEYYALPPLDVVDFKEELQFWVDSNARAIFDLLEPPELNGLGEYIAYIETEKDGWYATFKLVREDKKFSPVSFSEDISSVVVEQLDDEGDRVGDALAFFVETDEVRVEVFRSINEESDTP